MAEDTSKNLKIKLSLNDLTPKTTETEASQRKIEDLPPDQTANLQIKPAALKIPSIALEEAPKINIETQDSAQDDKPKISLKKPQLQDIKLKVNFDKSSTQTPAVAPSVSSSVPAYARSNVPNQAESNASSPSLKIEEDMKGKTQRIIESEPVPRKPIIDLNSLKIDLNKESGSDSSEANQIPQPPLPNIDFSSQGGAGNNSLSDTVKLRVKSQTMPAPKPFASLGSNSKEKEPNLAAETSAPLPKIASSKGAIAVSAQKENEFVIPTNVADFHGAQKGKKNLNILFLSVGIIILIAIIYFMITTIKSLA